MTTEIPDQKEYNEEDNWKDRSLCQLYRLIVEMQEQFTFNLPVPLMALFGVQSAGKSSVLTNFLGMPASYIRQGTGTRCPVEYVLSNDSNAARPIIDVDGTNCSGAQQMIEKLAQHMQDLGETFSSTKVIVTIKWDKVPDMVLVDLPGLIVGDNPERATERREIEQIISKFLTERQGNSEHSVFKYIPIVVRPAVDIATEQIRSILTTLTQGLRDDWMEDACFIVTKFDAHTAFSSGTELLTWFNNIRKYVLSEEKQNMPFPQNTVVVSCNPNQENFSDVTLSENDFIRMLNMVPEHEANVLNDLGERFFNRSGVSVVEREEWKIIRRTMCGRNNMRKLIEKKMQKIMAGIVPDLNVKLASERIHLEDYLQYLRKRRELIDPRKLSSAVIAFADDLSTCLRQHQSGDFKLHIDSRFAHHVETVTLTWEEEMIDFYDKIENFYPDGDQKIRLQEWNRQWYMDPERLMKLFEQSNRDFWKSQMELKLCGNAMITRALHLWIAMTSLIDFETLSKNCDIWSRSNPLDVIDVHLLVAAVRNVVGHTTQTIEFACLWIGSYLNYRYDTDASMMYNYLLETNDYSFARGTHLEGLLQTVLMHYKESVKNCVANFNQSSTFQRQDYCEIIAYHQPAIFKNLAQFIKLPGEEKIKETDFSPMFLSLIPEHGFEQPSYNSVDFIAKVMDHAQAHFQVIQYAMITNTSAQVCRRVIGEIEEHTASLKHCIHQGHNRRQCNIIMKNMSRWAGIRIELIEDFFEEKMPESNLRSVLRMGRDELAEIIGINREELDEQIREQNERLTIFLMKQKQIQLALRRIQTFIPD